MKYYEKISYDTIGVIKTISIITAPFVKLLTFSTNIISKIFGVQENEEEIVTEEEIKALEKGVKIEDYVSGKAKVKILKIDEEKDVSRIEIIIHEGKNREVRKMCNAIGKKVLALHRSRIGNLNVKDLKIGEWKYLNNKQIESLIK